MHQPQALHLSTRAVAGTGPRRRRRLLLVPAVIGLALAAAACGDGSPTAGVASLSVTTTSVISATATGGGPPNVAGLMKYARCIRAHGVSNFPEPNAPPGAARAFKESESAIASTAPFLAAQRACAKYAPARTPPPQITTKDQADYLEAANCMRAHGISGFPDPVFSAGEVNFPIPAGMDTNSTPFRRAVEICETLIPPGLPYSKEAEGGQ